VLRIEGFLENRRSDAVMHQIDLHAADIDRAMALCLVGAHGGDGRRLGRKEMTLAFDIDGPGPGNFCPALGSQRPDSPKPMARSRWAGMPLARSAWVMAAAQGS